MPKNLFNIKTLNKINKELIRDLSFLYDLDPYSMSEIVKASLNEMGMIDKEELRKNSRKYYQYNNSNKLPPPSPLEHLKRAIKTPPYSAFGSGSTYVLSKSASILLPKES